jgi:ABC-type multidrug transport system permease subunit
VSQWFNYTAAFKILVFGLLIGAALPALFAVGVRLNAEGAGVAEHGGTVAQKNPILVALSWVIFALVLFVVIAGVLFIARDFIGHQTGLYLLGAKPK